MSIVKRINYFLIFSLGGTAEMAKERERGGYLHSYTSSFRGWGDDHLPLKEKETETERAGHLHSICCSSIGDGEVATPLPGV